MTRGERPGDDAPPGPDGSGEPDLPGQGGSPHNRAPALGRASPREYLVNVQLTLLSIIVALVLENLLSHLSSIGIAAAAWPGAVLPWLESFAVLTSVIATWAGFGMSFSLSRFRPHPFDFLAPFVLLITLYIAVQYIGGKTTVQFLAAIGGASLAAALMLLLEVRRARGHGPKQAFVAQLVIGLWYWLGAVLIWTVSPGLWVVAGILAVAAAVESVALMEIFRQWRNLISDD